MGEVEIARDAISGSIALFIGNFFSTIITAAVALVLARFLGPSDYGIFALCLVLPTIIYQVLDFGIGSSVSHYVAFYIGKGDRTRAIQITNTSIVFSTVTGFSLTIISYFLAGYFATFVLHRPEITGYVQIGSAIILAQSVFYISVGAYVGWNMMKLSALTSVIQAVTRLGLTVPLVLIGLGVTGALIANTLSFLVAGAIAIFLLLRLKFGGTARRAFSLDDIRLLARYSRLVFVGNLIYAASLQFVPIVLASLSSVATVGYYQAAANVTTAISIASLAISWSLLRAFSNLNSIGGNMSLALKYSVKYVGLLMTPAVIFLFPAAANLIHTLYGPSYSSGAVYLQLLALSFLPIVLGYSVTNPYFFAIPKTKFLMFQLIATGSSIFLTTAFFGYYLHLGPEGILFGLVISNFVWAILGIFFSSRFLKANIDFLAAGGIVLASFGAAAVVVVIGTFLGDGLIALLLELLIYVAVYMTLVPIIGVLNDLDLARLTAVLEKPGRFWRLVSGVLNYEKALANWRRKALSNLFSSKSQSAFVTESQ